MARTRAIPRRRPNINFDNRRVAAAKEMARCVRVSDVKIKFLLPQGKDVQVKVRGNVVRECVFEELQNIPERRET